MSKTIEFSYYPTCEKCGAAFVIRCAIVLVNSRWKEDWVFARDCKHRRDQVKMVKAKGK